MCYTFLFYIYIFFIYKISLPKCNQSNKKICIYIYNYIYIKMYYIFFYFNGNWLLFDDLGLSPPPNPNPNPHPISAMTYLVPVTGWVPRWRDPHQSPPHRPPWCASALTHPQACGPVTYPTPYLGRIIDYTLLLFISKEKNSVISSLSLKQKPLIISQMLTHHGGKKIEGNS